METSAFTLSMLDNMQQATTTALESLTHDELAWRPAPEANPIGFILWHQIRAEDEFILGMIQQKPSVWVSRNWYQKLNMAENPTDSGYDYTTEQVDAFPIPELSDLLGYAAAVRSQTVDYLQGISPDKFDEVIQTPFGEMAVNQIFSLLLCEITQHTGQIAYVRGLQKGLNK